MWQKNKLLVKKVILQVQLEYKVFQKYENAWPVRDLLAQYLCNSSQKEKKAAAKFQHKSGKRKVEDISVTDQESNHSDLSGSVDGDASNVESSCAEMASANEESNASFRRCSNNRRADSEGESDDDPRPLKSRPVQTLVAHQQTRLSPPEASQDESNDRRVDSEGESDDDPQPLKSKHDSRPQKRARDKSNDRQADSEGESDNPRPSKSRLTKAPVADDDELADNSDEDDPQPLKSRPMKTPVANDDKLADDSNEDDSSPGNIFPKTCPGMDC
ncbi:hypothetical protein EDC04DRAFT_2899934 [Pisolithus marmoratus]|nr:hypothetical protein EDC04DRAFT_2899934 [Pisolithus marmoratus]